jgi:hypothetical protein
MQPHHSPGRPTEPSRVVRDYLRGRPRRLLGHRVRSLRRRHRVPDPRPHALRRRTPRTRSRSRLHPGRARRHLRQRQDHHRTHRLAVQPRARRADHPRALPAAPTAPSTSAAQTSMASPTARSSKFGCSKPTSTKPAPLHLSTRRPPIAQPPGTHAAQSNGGGPSRRRAGPLAPSTHHYSFQRSSGKTSSWRSDRC